MSNQTDASTHWQAATDLYKQKKYAEAGEEFRKAVEADPKYTNAYNDWGVALVNLGKYEEAIEKFQKAVELDPNDAQFYVNFGAALRNLDKDDEAIEKYQKAIELDPENVNAYYNWGTALLNQQIFDKAIEKYQKAVEFNPKYIDAYYNWGNVLLELKEYDEAIEKTAKAVEIDSNFSTAYFNWGNALLSQKKYDEAIEKYKKAVEIDSNSATAYFNWGTALLEKKRYEEAAEKYQKVTEIDSNYKDAYFNWGLILSILKNYEKAIEKYRGIVELDSKYIDAYNNWGNVLFSQKKYEEAVEKYQKAAELNPDYYYAYHNIANCLWVQGKYQLGLDYWEKTRRVYERSKSQAKESNNVDFFQYYGTVLHEIFGYLDQAETVYQEGLTLDANHIGILLALINLYLEIKDENVEQRTMAYWKAREIYKRVEAILKEQLKVMEDAPTLLRLGQLYLVMEENAEAEKPLLSALEKDKEAAEPYTYLGILYTRREDFKKGAQYFEDALRRDPDNLTLRSNLAEAYLKAKLIDKAQGEYKKILAITVDHVEAQIGLGEVYTTIADAGDKEMYGQAIGRFTEGIRIAEQHRGSKRLKKKELAAVSYSCGYARVNLYESSRTKRNESLLQEAEKDFRKCVNNDPDHYKAVQALEKIDKRLRRSFLERLTEKVGPIVIVFLSMSVFILTQGSFFFKKPLESIDAKYHALLTFGSLAFMVAGLYLPQILKLKVAGIELEKSAVDQITTSGTLGISK